METFKLILPKCKRTRRNESHRWTEKETQQLLESIVDVIRKNSVECFEKPTARRFYDRVSQDSETLWPISWKAKKSKMRYLRTLYLNTDITDDVQKQRIPLFYEMLDEIYGHIRGQQTSNFHKIKSGNTSNIDPLIDFDDNKNAFDEKHRPTMDLLSNDEKKESSAPTTENLSAEHFSSDSDTSSSLSMEQQPKKLKKRKNENPLNALVDLQKRKVEIECNKLKLEKIKAEHEFALKTEELKNNLELKKIELANDKEIHRLRLESEERIKKYEIDCKLKMQL